MKWLSLIWIFFIIGCSVQPIKTIKLHDEQFVQIYIKWGSYDELNTFEETLVKDLIPGTVKIPFWLTKREQEIILTTAERVYFFSYPDTVKSLLGVSISPDHGSQVLRIKAGDKDKMIIWHEPVDRQLFKYYPLLKELQNLIINIVKSKPEYKTLPPTKGGYQ